MTDCGHILNHIVINARKLRDFLAYFLFGVNKSLKFVYDFSVNDFHRAYFGDFIAAEIRKTRGFDIDNDECFAYKAFGNGFNRVEKPGLRHIFEFFRLNKRIVFGNRLAFPLFGDEVFGKNAERNVGNFKTRRTVEHAQIASADKLSAYLNFVYLLFLFFGHEDFSLNFARFIVKLYYVKGFSFLSFFLIYRSYDPRKTAHSLRIYRVRGINCRPFDIFAPYLDGIAHVKRSAFYRFVFGGIDFLF